VDVEGAGDEKQVAEFRIAVAAFDALDRVDGDAGQFPQLLLGDVLVHAPGVDALTGPEAGVEDPRRLVGGHSTNAVPGMIIRPQQFCGFI